MIYLPIPTTPEWNDKTAAAWRPFLFKQAKHEQRNPRELEEEIEDGLTQIHLAMDEEKRAHAVLATQIVNRGIYQVGVLHWLAGSDPKAWFDLIAQVERYFREHVGAVAMIGEPRKGWARLLKRAGYQLFPHPTNPRLLLVEKELVT